MKVQQPAPVFSTEALLPNGTFGNIKLDQYKGKWLVLFFYPLDFTFVCPTEIIAFSERISDFEKLGTSVLACSVDSVHSHLAWTNVPRNKGGLGQMKIPILSDLTKSIAKDYGVLLESEGVALRGTFVIDPKGTLRIAHVNDLPVGRSVDEILRVIEALQFNEAHGDVCPANWKKGEPTMKPNPLESKDYFSKEFVNGVVFGFVLVIVLVFYLIFKTRVVPHSTVVCQEWPKELTEFLKRHLSADDSDISVGELFMSPTMDIAWRELNFIDLDLGDHAPKVIGARIIKGITPDLAIQMEFDIVYQGGASIAIEAIITGEIKLPTRIYLNEFAGQLRFRLPSLQAVDKIGVAFVKDPGVTFTIDAPLSAKTSDTVRGMVNRLLESIARKVFLDFCVLPAWVNFYMPLMAPNTLFEVGQVKDKVPEASSFTSSLASKAANLWEGKLFKPFSDFDPFTDSNLFSTDEDVSELSTEQIKVMQDQLVKKFIEISNIAHTLNSDDPSVWKSVKKKVGVELYKRIASNNGGMIEMAKARISIQCNCAKVFSLLSNSEHFRYVSDFFESATPLSQYDENFSVEKFLFKRSRAAPIRSVLFEVKKEISDFSFLVIFRTVTWGQEKIIFRPASMGNIGKEIDITDDCLSKAPLSLQESSANELRNRCLSSTALGNVSLESTSLGKSDIVDSKVYLFGYLIEMDPESPASLSNVTLLSCASPTLYAHLGTYKFCTKLKSFFEELVSLSYSIPVQDLNEVQSRKLDAQGNKIDQLKSYFGSTASYLLKNYKIIRAGENNRSDSGITDDESLNNSRLNLNSELENREMPTSFDDENYVDIKINSREVLKIFMEYQSKFDQDSVKFNWEFMSLTELPIYFGIEFSPSDSSKYNDSPYDRTESGSWIIFPFSCISAYAKPAFGKIFIQDFPSGKFLVSFDNLATSKRAMRQLTTRCWISDSSSLMNDIHSPILSEKYQRPLAECHFDLTIPRKTILAVPIPFYQIFQISQNFEDMKKVHLNWSTNTGGSDLYFSIFYQEKKSEFSEGFSAGEVKELSSMASIDSHGSVKRGDTSQVKISKLLGKAKDVYKEVKSAMNQPTSTSPESSVKPSISSRINAVVAKSEIASRTIIKAMSTQNQDLIFLESSFFIKNHTNSLMIFPHSKINSTEQPFQGILEITTKPGVYFFLFENSMVLASPKQITCSISIM